MPKKNQLPIVTEEEVKQLTAIEKLYQTAQTLETQNDFNAALCCYRKIATLQPSSDSYYNLGIKLYENGNLDEAIASFKSATTLDPKDADAYYNLGLALCARKDYKESIISFQKARLNGDDSANTYHCMGIAFQAMEQYSEAALFCSKALALNPVHIQAHLTLGLSLKCLGKIEEALACYHKLAKITPENTEVLRNLAELYRKQKESNKALDYYKQIITIEPDYFEAYKQSGIILHNQGYHEQASESFEKALSLKYDPGLVVRAALSLPVINCSPESIKAYREQLQERLKNLTDQRITLQDPYKEVGMTSFLPAYHNLNDKNLQQKIADFYLKTCPSLKWMAPHCDNPKIKRGKIKLGFISTFFYSHTIALLFFGVIEKISREDFHITVFRFSGNEDSLTSTIEQTADETVILPYELATAREKIAEKTPDILFYLDIGMEPMTYYLAFSRLAPVQCKRGHPVTSGIPNLDYFISCGEAETDCAEQHYSEQLVRLNTYGYYYYPPKVPVPIKQRNDFGLPPDAKLYICPQTLFKFHPDFDTAFAEILQRDPNGVLVLIEGREKSWTELLLNRFSPSFSDKINRVIVLPTMSAHDFNSLCIIADAILDTPGFTGGKISLDCFAFGLPIITLPSPYMRGRLTLAQYKLMGIDDCIADNKHHFVKLAIRLANDKIWKRKISEKIKQRSHVLFKNMGSINELEQFFIQAYTRITDNSDEMDKN